MKVVVVFLAVAVLGSSAAALPPPRDVHGEVVALEQRTSTASSPRSLTSRASWATTASTIASSI